ncbi:MAG TPA: response regulator [Anaerolineae bacterium]|nr:response regulator [Anaerolineae bacterium]
MANEALRILLVDDDEDDYLITEDHLLDIAGQPFQLDWTPDYFSALDIISRQEHDVYLIDYRLGQETGLDLLRWAVANGYKTPFILLTGQGDHQVDLAAMEAGAADFLVKGQIDAQLLERSIRYAVERHRAEETRQRLEEELRQSQKMEAIGHMAGGIAHDFNNILTAVLSFVGLAKRQVGEEHPAYGRLDGIEEASLRGAELTRQLLTFARRQVTVPRVFSLNELILNMDKFLRRLITADIELVTLPMPELCQIKADPAQIEQVLVNLVVNARDAMPEGGTLTIRTTRKKLNKGFGDVAQGNYICLIVSDTGMGMSKEALSHIFEPFYTTKAPGKGTGLGLATCYGIVKQNGGHISVESKPGEGAEFQVFLPAVHSEKTIDLTRPQSEVVAPVGDELILLVEDEPAVRQSLSEFLQKQGYKLVTAVNGEDALQQLNTRRDTQPDLLLTDMVMPQLGGAPLAKILKEKIPDLKALFISGYADESIVQPDALDPHTAYLQKPFTLDTLAYEIRQLLDKE